MSDIPENIKTLEAILARSNLVPTAGEFVPKSQQNKPVDDGSGGSLGRLDKVEGAYSVSQEQAGTSQRNKYRSNEYFSKNREPKFTKNKQNDRWKKTEKEFVNSNFGLKNRGEEKVGLLDSRPSEREVYHCAEPKSTRGKEKYTNRPYYKNGTTYYNWREGNPSGEDVSARKQSSRPFYSDNDSRKFNSPRTYGERDTSLKKNTEVKKTDEKNKTEFQRKYKRVLDSEDKVEVGKKNQREHLIDMLTKGKLECLVCCDAVFQVHPTWGCQNCHHVFHLKCIGKWARSSMGTDGWRCPACQHVTLNVPSDYFCFCGKENDPEWNHIDCPHSCGNICGKTHPNLNCHHKCVLLCHPGPCPPCLASVTRSCGCGRTSSTVQCCSAKELLCESVCKKLLGCQSHECEEQCHVGPCKDCSMTVHQDCFCSKEAQDVSCSAESAGVKNFSCGQVCGQVLTCGHHSCPLLCHDGDCGPCSLSLDLVQTCPCGQKEVASLLSEAGIERKSCLDPIPTCGAVCSKQLICGQLSSRHICEALCHIGECPPCPLETVVKCRCGHMDKTLPCAQLTVRADDARCDKRCSKKRSCGKHKCNQQCCIDIDHACPLPCNRQLGCGLHRCEALCHRGHCLPCFRASFEELYCDCGAQVMFPPIACGTKKPQCSEPCSRPHSCEHAPTHNCHSDPYCPPCTFLTKKYCHGRHELRKAVPCHQGVFSCGLACGKDMPCGRHKCILPCHADSCLKEGQQCVQPCAAPRSLCGHACNVACHDGPCPEDTQCKEMVRVTCECGNRFTTRLCHDNVTEYRRIATVQLASKMADLQAGQTVDLNDVTSASKKLSYKTLECNEECMKLERNRRLAIALQIRNPDLSSKLTPKYSELMRSWAKRSPDFCQMVHDKLTDLVQLAKQSKQKSRSYSFDPMNRDKRHFVHEYCEHFGCDSMAYDAEPKRNIVATALKDKSWLPSMSLLEVIQRENGVRKAPMPVNKAKLVATPISHSGTTMDILPGRVIPPVQVPAGATSSSVNTEQEIDYFDFT